MPAPHNSIIERTNSLLAGGRVHDAIAMATRAAQAGDPDALMQVAIWRLAGHPLPRDLPEARRLLRRAAEAGHADAALTEIALVGNGSGGAPDWPGALDLLRSAARRDAMAAAHLALIEAMALRPDGAPSTLLSGDRLSTSPDVTRFRQFCTPAECAHVASAAQHLLAPSAVADPRTGRLTEHPVRTSDGGVFPPTREDLVLQAINRRIALATETAVAQGEGLVVLRYRPGQQFRLHHDCLPGVRNQRIRTVLIYLNDEFTGGETQFPAASLTVRPQVGDAVVFTNTLGDGRPDPSATHAGLPVITGTKWLATRWIRGTPVDPWNVAQTAS